MPNISRRERERQTRETEILAAAEKIFYQKGYDDASMDEIAKESEFTKKTLYQYFINKEDLYFAIACKGYQKMLDYFEPVTQMENSGFEKMHRFVLAFYQFYSDLPQTFRLIKYCKFIKTSREQSSYYRKIELLISFMMQMFTKAMEEGQADGSIRNDLDAKMGAYSIAFLSLGFFYRLDESVHPFNSDPSLDREEFIRFSLELICNTIVQHK